VLLNLGYGSAMSEIDGGFIAYPHHMAVAMWVSHCSPWWLLFASRDANVDRKWRKRWRCSGVARALPWASKKVAPNVDSFNLSWALPGSISYLLFV